MPSIRSPASRGDDRLRPALFSRLKAALALCMPALLCAALLLGAAPARALEITPVFDSSITGAANAAQLEGAINAAISTVESLYSNTGTVGIIFSQASGNFLAISSTQDYSISYSQYTSLLQSNSTANPANTTLSTAIAHLASGNKPGPGGDVLVTSADARVALGVTSDTGCFNSSGTYVEACGQAYDGVITLNSSISFNYTTTPVAGKYSAIAAVEAQINEILGGGGQGSVLNSIPCAGSKTEYPNIGVLDLYRYTSAATPSFSSCSGTTAYLSVDGGNTDIIGFNDNPSYDLGDFNTNDNVQSAVPASGIVPSYTTASPEFTMMESIGYGSQLTLTATASSTAQVGQSYSQTNVASGGTGPYTYSVSAGNLPAGTTLNASTGTVSGTPTTSGPFSYTIEVTDSGNPVQTATQTTSGTIAPATLTLTATASSTMQVGQAYSQTNVASGGTPSYTYSVSAGTVPTGTTLNASTGTVSGTPTTAGAFSYTIEVTDSGSPAQTATQTTSGTIEAAAPIVTAVSPNSGAPAGGTSVTITGTNFTGATAVNFGATTASFTFNSATSISATSPAASAGTVDVTVTTPGGTSATGAADQFIYVALSSEARTWVSAVSGSDSNACTRTAPCLTFAAALADTSPGGEIDVLTPGDYGPVTITKAISIYNDGVGTAGALTTSGTSGITINAGANDTVNFLGLSFNGLTASGASGVVFNSGAQLHIANCTIQGFATSGITFAPGAGSASTAEMVIQDSTILTNGSGLSVKPAGGIAANVSLNKVHIDKNTGGGLRADGTGGSGAINVAVKDSSVSLNVSNGINAVSGPGNVTVNVTRSVIASNGLTGIQSNQSKGGAATVTVGSTEIFGNAAGVQSVGGGALLSYANTQLTGNTSNGSFTGSASLQ